MAIEPIVNVETANYLNAILLALFSFPLIVCPYEFMRGGKYQGAWFRGLRKSRRDRNYWFSQGMGVCFLVLGVISAFICPDSQLLCYQLAVFHVLMFLQTMWLLFAPESDAYGKVRPTDFDGLLQWRLNGFIVWPACMVVTILACAHTPLVATTAAELAHAPAFVRDAIRDRLPAALGLALGGGAATGEHYVSLYSCNLVGLAISSVFGVAFFFFPRHTMSQWFEDVDDAAERAAELEGEGDGAPAAAGGAGDLEMTGAGVNAAPTSSPNAGARRKAYSAGGGAGGGAGGDARPTFLGFTLLTMNGMDYFFARSIGIAILAFNLGMAIGWDGVDGIPNGTVAGVGTFHGSLSHPLYALQILFVSTLFLLHNVHALTMRNVSGIGYIKMTWLPNLALGAGLSIYFMLAQLTDKSG